MDQYFTVSTIPLIRLVENDPEDAARYYKAVELVAGLFTEPPDDERIRMASELSEVLDTPYKLAYSERDGVIRAYLQLEPDGLYHFLTILDTGLGP